MEGLQNYQVYEIIQPKYWSINWSISIDPPKHDPTNHWFIKFMPTETIPNEVFAMQCNSEGLAQHVKFNFPHDIFASDLRFVLKRYGDCNIYIKSLCNIMWVLFYV